jgi:nitrous oxide reductase accessory protein NosL
MKGVLFFIVTVMTTLAFSAIEKPQTCVICGMDRQEFAYSRTLLVFDDTIPLGTCSIVCARKAAADNAARKITSIKVGDYDTKELIDAKTAIWVIGGNKKGVMSATATWAFSTKTAAEKFIAASGGKPATFHEVWWENSDASGHKGCPMMKGSGDGSKSKDCPMRAAMGQGASHEFETCHHRKTAQTLDEVSSHNAAKVATDKDKCPVCGMFVAKYPGFLAQIQFRDGSTAFFDGPKDFFNYYLAIDKYNPGKKTVDILAVFVTNYYTQSPINARTALYVAGSDINGPMGKELVPFEKTEEAGDFKKDHKGTALFLFNDVTTEVLKGLDK